ncbi:MAG: DNA alkylation repair protein [Coriobacteriia bacterium]|nr:DNA alkylation repair protein [Coriobacteriia bacterium]
MNKIQKQLFKNQDLKYRDFSAKLTPTIPKENFIGVRVPVLRKLAKQFTIEDCKAEFPHKYVEENTLHGLVICNTKDYAETIEQLDELLPYVDNWATCDIISPKCFKKKDNRKTLVKDILRWMSDNKTYTIRFGIEMAMSHFLDDNFNTPDGKHLMNEISKVRSNEYYVNMMVAWYFATALAKQWDATIHYLEKKNKTNNKDSTAYHLDGWTHNKAIQKARESYRITPEQKEYLNTLKVPLAKRQ